MTDGKPTRRDASGPSGAGSAGPPGRAGHPAAPAEVVLDAFARAAQPFIVVGPDEEVLYANPAGQRLLGQWSPGPARPVPEALREHLRRARKAPAGLKVEVEQAGRAIEFDVLAGPGGRVYFYGRDVTHQRLAEAALEASEEWFRAIFEQAAVGIAQVGPDGRWLRVNRKLCEMLGYGRRELLGLRTEDVTHPADLEVERGYVRRALAGEIPSWSMEKRYVRKDRTVVWARLTAALVRDASGEPDYFIFVAEDITRARRTREEHEAILRHSSDLIAVLDAAGCFRYANPAWEELLGYTPAELLGRPAGELMHPEDRPAHETERQRLLFGGVEEGFECRLLARDGAAHRIAWRLATDPEAGLLYCVGRDVTERDRAERALRASEALYRTIFEQAAVGTAEIDAATGRYLRVNRRYCEILGMTEEEMTATDFMALTHSEDLAGDIENIRRLRSGQIREFTTEKRYRRKDGSTVWVMLTVSPMWLPGEQPTTCIAVVQDISDRKRMEAERERLIAELERRNTEMDRFGHTISHDLRSPLITIQGFIGQVLSAVEAGRTQQAVEDCRRIAAAAGRMQQLLDQLRELSRVGRVASPPQKVFLGETVRETLESLRATLDNGNITVQVSPDLPVVYGDPTRLREVLQNLIENAARFMGAQGRPRIEVGCRSEGGETVIYVRDNGIGIEPAHHEKIFNPFEKLDPHSGGTGVGLALVRRIVETHGGRVWVESDGPGRGATFCFTLPPPGEGT